MLQNLRSANLDKEFKLFARDKVSTAGAMQMSIELVDEHKQPVSKALVQKLQLYLQSKDADANNRSNIGDYLNDTMSKPREDFVSDLDTPEEDSDSYHVSSDNSPVKLRKPRKDGGADGSE